MPGRIDAIGRFKQLELEVDPFAFAVVPFPIRIILFAALRITTAFAEGIGVSLMHVLSKRRQRPKTFEKLYLNENWMR